MAIAMQLDAKPGYNIGNLIRYYFGYCKAAIFTIGMIFSYSLAEYGVVVILITYFIDFSKVTLPKAAAILNLNEGATTILAILMAHIADAYFGRFNVVVISSFAYCIGLILFYILEVDRYSKSNGSLLYMGLVLVAVGRSNREPTLKAFLADQFKMNDNDQKRTEARTNVWWCCFGFVGLVIGAMSTFRIHMTGRNDFTWAAAYKISASAIGLACFLFWCGFPCYNCNTPTGSPTPLTTICRVIWAATWKRSPDYPCQCYDKDNLGNAVTLQQTTNPIRWLDKAAIIESSSQSLEEQEKKWMLCTITQVKEVRLLFRMHRMWGTFLVYSLVKSTGITFFIEQGNNLKPYIINNINVPLSSLVVIKSFSKLAISNVYNLLSKRVLVLFHPQEHYATKVRMGIGMLSSIFCCAVAWRVEARRMNIFREHGSIDTPYNKDVIPMSILWLVPQFVLLGLMEGLAEDGLQDFFYDQAPESMRSYGPPFNYCVVGIGSFFSALCVYASRSWFPDTLNNSRLDKYYRMLTIFCFLNWLLYQYISAMYSHNESALEEELETIVDSVTGEA